MRVEERVGARGTASLGARGGSCKGLDKGLARKVREDGGGWEEEEEEEGGTWEGRCTRWARWGGLLEEEEEEEKTLR